MKQHCIWRIAGSKSAEESLRLRACPTSDRNTLPGYQNIAPAGGLLSRFCITAKTPMGRPIWRPARTP
eukprot:12052887-Alexandrium_andersonii.AAC.1